VLAVWLTCVGLISPLSVAAEPSRITDGSKVTVLYHITVPGEKGFNVRDVGQFVQGKHQMLPAVERVVTGMKTGDEKKVDLSAEEAFGPYDEKKKKTVSRSDLPPEAREGDVVEDDAGEAATVTQLSGRTAVIDYNHPLAGKPLRVEIKILQVRAPS
jgi:FKBP-type peptidyl-prolyl cis-trans isomerase 2